MFVKYIKCLKCDHLQLMIKRRFNDLFYKHIKCEKCNNTIEVNENEDK